MTSCFLWHRRQYGDTYDEPRYYHPEDVVFVDSSGRERKVVAYTVTYQMWQCVKCKRIGVKRVTPKWAPWRR